MTNYQVHVPTREEIGTGERTACCECLHYEPQGGLIRVEYTDETHFVCSIGCLARHVNHLEIGV